MSGWLMRLRHGVERGRLAATGRAGDQDDAVGPADQRVHQRVVARREAQVGQVEQHARLVEEAHHDALEPRLVGMVETRTSMLLPAIFSEMRPSCGRRFSAMFSAAMIFTRAMIELMNCLLARLAT